MDPSLQTVGGLQTLVQNLSSGADQTFGNNPAGVNLGTAANPLITVVNGDFNMGNSTGAGFLIVTGVLTMSGNPAFNGVILVIGKGDIEKAGGGGGSFNGSIFVANLYDAAGHLLPANGPPGQATLNWNGGGNVSISYDSCWTNGFVGKTTLRVLTSREQLY
jgi:hypothetical protein